MALMKTVLFCIVYLTEANLSGGLVTVSITRHHKGDIFIAQGEECYKGICDGISSGTGGVSDSRDCECKCGQHLPVYRDDLNICVDDIRECTLVPFVSGNNVKKIPYVFLPLKGQIVYPSAEIVISELGSPVCVVSGGQFLGRNGWLNLRNNSETEPPFRLFRDEGRTYLQWVGETSTRMAMEGRIILVHLICKDASLTEDPKIFTPCIAFRVAGNPSVREVIFSSDMHLAEGQSGALSLREYVAIGLCSLFLVVVYVASVLFYLHWRKQKKKNINKKNEEDAQLTLGEEGVVKSNPLLQANRHLGVCGEDNAGYVTDSNSCCSDPDQISDLLCMDEEDITMLQNVQTSAIIHPCGIEYGETTLNQDPNSIERLPEENVSIVETLEAKEAHPETIKAIASTNGRRKLYFNPSYFEPELLKAPPPAALEFLTKIREVITIAKHKMSSKKFSPSLLGIPEEDGSLKADGSIRGSLTFEQKTDNHESTKAFITDKDEKTNSSNYSVGNINNEYCCSSDAKQRIIQKWLEDLPVLMLKGEDNKYKSSTASEDDKIEGKLPFFPVNKVNKKSNLKENNRDATISKQNKKRPSTKSRPPPLPPQSTSKTPTEKSRTIHQQSVELTSISDAESKKESTSSGNEVDQTSGSITGCASTHLPSIIAPRPPPLPLSHTDLRDDMCHLPGTDICQSEVAKNLMDAVIQELTGFKKTDKIFDTIDISAQNKKVSKENNRKLQESKVQKVNEKNKACYEKKNVGNKERKIEDIKINRSDNLMSSTSNLIDTHNVECKEKRSKVQKIQDEHEYEIILLNSEAKSEEKSNSKVHNISEIFPKSNKNEGYSLVSEVYVNDSYSFSNGDAATSNSGAENGKISYEIMDEKSGRLTIHVKDSSKQSKEFVSESDNFEPDTLDRKQRKSKLVQRIESKNDESDRYSNQRFHDMDCSKKIDTSETNENFTDSLERPTIMLKTSGSFKRNSLEKDVNELFRNLNWARMENFGSLREIYEAKSRNHKRRTETTSLIDSFNSDTDCISTLSWSEERRNKLLHHGIVLHIEDVGRRQRNRFQQNEPHFSKRNYQDKPLSRSSKTSLPPKSASPSPAITSQAIPPFLKMSDGGSTTSAVTYSSPRSLSPPLPPRSLPVPPHVPQSQPRSTASSPVSPIEDRVSLCGTPPLHSSINTIVRVNSKNDCAMQYQCTPFLPNSKSISFSSVPLAPPRPPKIPVINSPPLPPRNIKPPLPPKNLNGTRQRSGSGKFSTRPLPPLPFPKSTKDLYSTSTFYKDLETLSTLSGASMDSLNSSECESFYTIPHEEDYGNFGKADYSRIKNSSNFMINTYQTSAPTKTASISKPAHQSSDANYQSNILQANQAMRNANKNQCQEGNRAIPHRPDDSGYLSTDSSDSYCPQIVLPPYISRIPENAESSNGQNSETEESFGDGASESGAESTATDSFSYGNFKKAATVLPKNSEESTNSQIYPYSLRLSDVEVNSDTERHCVPIMVRP